MLYTIYNSLNQLQIRLLVKLVDLFILVLDKPLCPLWNDAGSVACVSLGLPWAGSMACVSLGLRQVSPSLNLAHPQAQPFWKAPAQLCSPESVRRWCLASQGAVQTSWVTFSRWCICLVVTSAVCPFSHIRMQFMRLEDHGLPAVGRGLLFSSAC